MKTALDRRPVQGGRAKIGANVEVGYFSQDAEDLDPDMSPLDVLVYEDDLLPEAARKLLGRFLLSGDDVFRPVKSLSGGEKNKLSLARLTHADPNLLVLDEPTNHLDMDSREALIEILRDYQGTLLLVSHDRHLLNAVTDHTLDVQTDGVKEYGGPYAEYVRKAESLRFKNAPSPSGVKSAPKAEPTASVPAPRSPLPAKPVALDVSPRELSKLIDKHTRLIKDREMRIAELETEIRVTEDGLSSPNGADVVGLSHAHADLTRRLEDEMIEWERLHARQDELRGMQNTGV